MSLMFIPAGLRSGHLLRGRAGKVKADFGSTGTLFKNAIKTNVFICRVRTQSELRLRWLEGLEKVLKNT